jgi:Spy/CpxP family protein refolding chaperone
MHTAMRPFLAFGLMALISTPVLAQQGRGPGRGGMGGGTMLLSNEGVHKELKLEDDQVSKVKTLADDLGTKMRESFQSLQSLEGEERTKKMQELGKENALALHKGLAEILKPEQVKRFKQIEWQQGGANALANAEVAEALKLTDEQKTKVKDLLADHSKQQRELFQAAQGDREGAREKMIALTKETKEKGLALLTAEQKTSFDTLLGSPYEVIRQQPQR